MWVQHEGAACKPGREPSPKTEWDGSLILDFLASRAVRKINLCCLRPLSMVFCYGSPRPLRDARSVLSQTLWGWSWHRSKDKTQTWEAGKQLGEVVTWQICLSENWLWGCVGLSAEECVSGILCGHSLAMWPWISYWISLCFSFPTYLKNRPIAPAPPNQQVSESACSQ